MPACGIFGLLYCLWHSLLYCLWHKLATHFCPARMLVSKKSLPCSCDHRTSCISDAVTTQAGARYAEGLLKALGVQQAIVVGHSAGALTAMELFKRYVSVDKGTCMTVVLPHFAIAHHGPVNKHCSFCSGLSSPTMQCRLASAAASIRCSCSMLRHPLLFHCQRCYVPNVCYFTRYIGGVM